MPEPTAPRPDVPDELIDRLLEAANDECVEMPRFEAGRILAAVLPAHARQTTHAPDKERRIATSNVLAGLAEDITRGEGR